MTTPDPAPTPSAPLPGFTVTIRFTPGRRRGWCHAGRGAPLTGSAGVEALASMMAT